MAPGETGAEPAPPAPPAAARRRMWQALRKYGLAVPLLALAALALGVLALDSGIGHRLIADIIAENETETGLSVGIGRIDGSIFGHAVLEDVTFRDPHGPFLRAAAVDLDWRPLAWFDLGLRRGTLDIRRLVMRRGTLSRVPHFRPRDPEAPLLPNFDIRVDRLAVERLAVARAVLGSERRVDLDARADLREGRALAMLNGRLGGADRLSFLLDADRRADRFVLGLDYAAPRGGLLAALTGAGSGRKARIDGAGSWRDWRGTLMVEGHEGRQAALRLANRSGDFALAGLVWTAPFFDPATRRLFGETVALKGQARFAGPVLEGSLDAGSAIIHASAKGGVDLAANRFHHLVLAAETRQALPMGPGGGLDRAQGEVVLEGAFTDLDAAIRLSTGRWSSGEARLEGLGAKGTAHFDGRQWLLPLDFSARALATGHPLLDARLGAPHGRAVLVLAGDRLSTRALNLASAGLSARLALTGELAHGQYRLSGHVGARGWVIPDVGRADGDAAIDAGWARDGHWQGGVRLSGRMEEVTSPGLARLAGESFAFAGEARGDDRQPALLSRARIAGDVLNLSLSGQRAGDGALVLSGGGRHAAWGSFAMDARLAGDGLHASLALTDPWPAGGVRDVTVALAPGEGGDLAITARGQSALGPFDGTLALGLPANGPARLAVKRLTLSDTVVSGALALGRDGVAGDLGLAGGGVSGTMHFSPGALGQGLAIDLAANAAHFGGEAPLTIGTGQLQATGLILRHHSSLSGSLRASGIGKGRLFIGQMAAQARLVDGAGQVSAAITGRRHSNFELQLGGEVAPDRFAVMGHGLFGGQPIAMPRRAVFTPAADGNGWQLAPSEIDFGHGRAIASGQVGNGVADLHLALADMPLALGDVVFSDLGLGGTVSGMLAYTKRREALPGGEARLMVKGLTRAGLVLTSRPIDLALVGQLSAQALQLRAVASEAGQVLGRVQAVVSGLPDKGGLVERLNAGQLAAQMRYAGPADAPWRLMAMDNFDLTGPIEIAADVAGALDNPGIRGSIASDDLRLQSASTGTDISHIVARGSFGGSRLSFTRLAGQTAGGGIVAGSGAFDFSGITDGRRPGIDLKLATQKAQVVARTDLQLTVSGPMRIWSDGTQGVIAGRVAIDSARWRLGQAPAVAALPNISTREINRSADVAPASARRMMWRYLVDGAGGGKVRLTGLGLDSDWSADIRLRGSLDAPALEGKADLVGGSYEFAGSRFELTRGHITFNGASPVDPRLDIAATSQVTGLSATVTVRGTSLKPEIAFSSTPPLPEEELLSRLLFSDSVSKISAPEAMQLGVALASLHGGTGLDPINKVRSVIGLDRLRIVAADPTIPRQDGVAAGKNISRHLYAEVITDGRGYSATDLEFRITRWLSLLGSVSTVGRQSVNARFSHDY